MRRLGPFYFWFLFLFSSPPPPPPPSSSTSSPSSSSFTHSYSLALKECCTCTRGKYSACYTYGTFNSPGRGEPRSQNFVLLLRRPPWRQSKLAGGLSTTNLLSSRMHSDPAPQTPFPVSLLTFPITGVLTLEDLVVSARHCETVSLNSPRHLICWGSIHERLY